MSAEPHFSRETTFAKLWECVHDTWRAASHRRRHPLSNCHLHGPEPGQPLAPPPAAQHSAHTSPQSQQAPHSRRPAATDSPGDPAKAPELQKPLRLRASPRAQTLILGQDAVGRQGAFAWPDLLVSSLVKPSVNSTIRPRFPPVPTPEPLDAPRTVTGSC